MKIGNGEFWLGDCLELLSDVPDGSVDMVLCDLPYGTTQNKWDSVLPFEQLWEHYWRVCKPNAAVVLTAAQPFTSALIMSQMDRFAYCWIWRKSRVTGVLNAKIQPLRNYEDICVFQRSTPKYNPQGVVECDKTLTDRGQSKNYGAKSAEPYKQTQTGYPRQVLEIASEGKTAHPTQKPVALFEYLIKTYTDEGMLVLDNCAGSGTTAVAAERTGRRWLCIEQLAEYYYPAVGRVWSEINA